MHEIDGVTSNACGDCVTEQDSSNGHRSSFAISQLFDQ